MSDHKVEQGQHDFYQGPKFVEEDGEQVNCVLQQVLHSTKQEDSSQHNIFWLQYTVEKKVCNLSRSCENCGKEVSGAFKAIKRKAPSPYA